ncbi:sulfatase-like hydrolase/transferase [Tamlana agarivorans]|uniref:Sulfatase-like hydrolase/transferase n=1 Tax=Pseudotamlana agarivorans TaxID=481183 RepID=A0ACC5U8P4_9FLAO|nr:sulfatase-like hydrolase/transferase [Tamlana agarivorans]MBU2950603.1 sulfatase-like hydrolase/transferase [Tamlana agarivorans]
MNTLKKIKILSVMLFCLTLSLKSFSQDQPNIIYILTDDLGYGDISAYYEDGKINTPNIDKLAAEGLMFTDAHTTSSVCTPTRYSILTGRYNWRTELKSSVLDGESESLIPSDRKTVASMLQSNGYQTAYIGKWHLGWNWAMSGGDIDFSQPLTHGPNDLGFDYAFGHCGSLDMAPYVYVENGMPTSVPTVYTSNTGQQSWRHGLTADDFVHEDVTPNFINLAIDYVEENANGNEPFFLYLPLPSPHTPILPTEEFLGTSGLGLYGDFVIMVDDYIGRLLDQVEASGIENNTLIIFTSDNGCSPKANFSALAKNGHDPSGIYRGMKSDIFEGGHRVPFIAKWPNKIQAGQVSDALISTADFMATCADIVGYNLLDDEGEDSYSMMPLLENNPGSFLREAAVTHAIDGDFAITKDGWKLILCPGSGGWSDPTAANTGGLPAIQLYNLNNDPSETNNLQTSNAAKVNELGSLLKKYILDGRSTPGAQQDNDPINFEWTQIDFIDDYEYDGGGGNEDDENLALGGTASQSSTDYDAQASRAIDGNTNGKWSGGSVTHTLAEDNPWWEVDLGANANIGDIVIYNRSDACCIDRLSDFTITIRDNNDNEVYSRDVTGYPNPASTYNAGGVTGRTVRITSNLSWALTIAEVEVYGVGSSSVPVTGVSVSPSSASLTIGNTQQLNATVSPANASNQNITWSTSNGSVATVNSNGLVTAQGAGSVTITATTADGGFTDNCSVTVTVPSTGGNLALNGTASQSSLASGGIPSRAIDGDTNGKWAGGSVTHTASTANPWWQVDLGFDTTIGDINVFGRTDACCIDRLSNFTVSVINSSDVTTYSNTYTTYPDPSVSMNAGNVQGKIIKIQLNATSALSLAEVQVYEGGGSSNPTINTFIIQENETGFCSVDGNVNNNNLNYTGDGFANTANALGNGVNWEIDGSAGSYTFTWGYASTTSRPGALLINGATVASSVEFNPSGGWSTWTTTGSTTVTLGAGVKTVRLEATGASGLGNIDFMEVTGPDATASGCLETAKFTSNKSVEENTSMFKIYPNPVDGQVNIDLANDENAQYQILNTSGQVMLTGYITGGKRAVDLNNFEAGFYLIKVTGASTSQIRKIIKN